MVGVIAGQHFAKKQRLVIGGGIGAFFFPFSISALTKGIGIEQALWFYATIGLAMALAAVLCPHTRDISLDRYYIAGDSAIFTGEGEGRIIALRSPGHAQGDTDKE